MAKKRINERGRVVNASQGILLLSFIIVSIAPIVFFFRVESICTRSDDHINTGIMPMIRNEINENPVQSKPDIIERNKEKEGLNLAVGQTSTNTNTKDGSGLQNLEGIGNNTNEFKKGKHVIFYNAFVNPHRKEQSLDIMKEQMLQVYNSSLRNATVFYNILGNDPRQKFCPNDMDCRKMNYIRKGDEVDTLQDLHDHCIANPNDIITYLHDKGSFNNIARNHVVRRLATKSATSEACKYMGHNKKFSCNLCALKVFYLPNTQTMANMWSANCTYIRKLIRPKDFERKRREMYVHIRTNPHILDRFHCLHTLLNGVDSNQPYKGDYAKELGLGRYALETWVFSSPDLMPCHTIPGSPANYDPSTWEKVKLHGGAGLSALHFAGPTATGWFQLYGRIFTYQYLYGSLPPADSWFWERIPQAFVKEKDQVKCDKKV